MKQGLEIIKSAASGINKSAGVYRMLDADGNILYIGKAKDVKKRILQYTQLTRLPTRLQRMVAKTRSLEFIFTGNEAEALLLEASLIKKHQPPFNLMLKDDKSYPFIKIDYGHDFPRIYKYRGKLGGDKTEYYGPYASVGAVNQAISLLQKLFLLRPCKDSFFNNRSKPCLQYQIKRCSAPCVGRIDKSDYAALLADARNFLKGGAGEIRQKIAAEMESASTKMDFEQAAILRDRLRALAAVQQEQNIYVDGVENADFVAIAENNGKACVQVFGFRKGQNMGSRSYFLDVENGVGELITQFISQFYLDNQIPAEIYVSADNGEFELLGQALSMAVGRVVKLAVPKRGDKKDIMDFALKNAQAALAIRQAEHSQYNQQYESMAKLLNLPALPKRIEIYDNSHISGQYALGVMVVAGQEGFIRNSYRIFNSRDMSLAAGDDYGLMREVMRRRFKQGDASPDKPDLMLIDGGLGQLNAVNSVLADLGVKNVWVIAIAKGPDRNAGKEEFHIEGQKPFRCKDGEPALYLLQRMRDEAHRFAIGSHRKRRGKAMTSSKLDEIAGIGPKRRKLLLHRFGSVKGIAEAGIDELAAVDGIGSKVAMAISEALMVK